MSEFYYRKGHEGDVDYKLGVVLAKNESNSSPGKFHEVRTADSDGVTYCTCRGWIQAINKVRHTGAEAICTHIRAYRSAPAAQPIVIMNFEQFALVKRGIHINVSKKTVSGDLRVKRTR